MRFPGSTAPFLARESRIPTSKVYDILNRLVSKGFVLEEPGKPKKFRGIDPDIALKSHLGAKRKLLDEMELRMSTELKGFPAMETGGGVWILKGRTNVEAMIEKIVARTSERLFVRYSSDGLYLKNIAKGMTGIRMDVKRNAIGSNILNSDGREMLIYLNKKEALWITNSKYCRIKGGRYHLDEGLSKYTDGEDVPGSQGQA